MTKITVDKDLIEQALQQLNLLDGGAGVCESANHVKGHQHTSREPCPIDKLHQDAIAALRAALDEPAVVEPVAEITGIDEFGPMLGWYTHWAQLPIGAKLYATNVRKPSQMLTEVRAMFAPQRTPAEPAPEPDDQLHCDICGDVTDDPWHFSTSQDRHKHACDKCWESNTVCKSPAEVCPVAEVKALAEPAVEPVNAWRKLAHQFDAHRMQAIWHLKAMTQDPQAHMVKAVDFLYTSSAQPHRAAVEPAAEIVAGVTHPQAKELVFTHHGLSLPVGTKFYTSPPPPAEQDAAYRAAKYLAEALFKKHYARDECYASGAIEWGLCDSTAGIISQIDNMVCQLVQPPSEVPLLSDREIKQIARESGLEKNEMSGEVLYALKCVAQEQAVRRNAGLK